MDKSAISNIIFIIYEGIYVCGNLKLVLVSGDKKEAVANCKIPVALAYDGMAIELRGEDQ